MLSSSAVCQSWYFRLEYSRLLAEVVCVWRHWFLPPPLSDWEPHPPLFRIRANRQGFVHIGIQHVTGSVGHLAKGGATMPKVLLFVLCVITVQ